MILGTVVFLMAQLTFADGETVTAADSAQPSMEYCRRTALPEARRLEREVRRSWAEHEQRVIRSIKYYCVEVSEYAAEDF